MKRISLLIFLLFSTFIISAFSQQEQKFAELGDFKLGSGETIRDLKIGYRTFGSLNPDKSNIVVYLMWAGGRTEQPNFKPSNSGKLIDTNKFFVVAIDPLSNGVSSSPSNSKLQPRMKFPRYTMRDVVNSQYAFLTKILKINHVKAVIGLSMGGMQTFQWMVSYPEFMDKAIPIVGSPQLAPYDLLHWQTQISAIMNAPDWLGGNYTKNPAREFEYEIGALLLTTPDEFNRRMTREKVLAEIEKAKTNTGGSDANDKIRQTQAMMSIDVTEKFGGSWETTAAAVKAKSLIIVDKFDHTVTPAPALKFAGLLKAETLVLEGDCGHSTHLCEKENVDSAVARFLEN
ncbi:MAG TPA: alpha/beta fold hydrolase [Pyrinomonadaceae bacterium]|nr:alpha/beta fold hydrolase [Pyrinomonadaceae bacterium]